MVIDINNISPQPSGKPRNGTADGTAAETATPKVDTANTSSSAVDTFELSDQAKSLARVQQALQGSPEVDEAKVQAITQQIANGTYQVNAEQLADKILADDSNFLL